MSQSVSLNGDYCKARREFSLDRSASARDNRYKRVRRPNV